ncbi:uncharacterized protein LOC116350465 [Contarinia nasturtii]|uniref:uncharacterized protein LOC116350465 n=1 Tax=Contarinia nasturtii TaxID=265458 RepID=UPI0012D435CB|nr:uncharacterized protein LOC116350465 [Contarinia nasturtii]
MSNSEGEQNTVAALFELQADLLAKMDRNITNFQNEPPHSKAKIDRLNTRLQTYHRDYDDFVKNHQKLVKNAKPNDKKHDYFKSFHIDFFESKFLDAVSAVREHIGKITATQSVSVSEESAQNHSMIFNSHSESEVRLPPIELPTFSGEFTEWPSFADRFGSAVHKRNISDANKLVYLKSTLRGDAALLISELTTTDANYLTAWKLLKENYENKRVIFNHAMNTLLNYDAQRKETASSFKSLIGNTDATVKSLESIGIDKSIVSKFIAFLVCSKLPLETISFIEQNIASHDSILEYEELKKILFIRIRSLDIVNQTKRDTVSNNNSNYGNNVSSTKQSAYTKPNVNTKKVNTYHFSSKPSQSNPNQPNGNVFACKLCSDNHPIRICSKFLSFPSNERESTVERLRLCRNCLSPTHLVAACKSPKNCRECGSRHHTLIHPYHRQAISASTNNSHTNNENHTNNNSVNSTHSIAQNSGNPIYRSNHNQTINLHSFRQVLLATTIVKVRASTGDYVPLRALFDQGGDGTSISESAIQLLKLPTHNHHVEIRPFGGGAPLYANKIVELNLKSMYNDSFQVTAPAVVMSSLTDCLPANFVKVDNWPHIEGLELADPSFFKSSKIDLVLGADIYYCALMEGLKKGPIGTPMAQQTELGWILSGPVTIEKSIPNIVVQNHVTIDLNESIQRFFEMESLPQSNLKSKDDQYCQEFFDRTTIRTDDGRLQMRLPFKLPRNLPTTTLGKSKEIALQQFLRLERRFKFNANFKSEYSKGMEDYIEQNHMQLATNTEKDCIHFSPEGEMYYESYYIPHHAVIKEDRVTTKLRNVFNASQKSSNGNSLNDVLYPGPVMLADLVAILLNWRCHRIAFCADIQQMYRQIRIHPDDITYQRLFWRKNFDEEIQEYCMNRLTFVTNFAPSFAIMGLHYLAKNEEAKFPQGSEIIRNDTYMDDTISGSSTTESALRDQHETIEILNSAGMNLRKWASNAPELLQSVPEEHRVDFGKNVSLTKHESIKTLGTFWNTSTDTFHFQLSIDCSSKQFTKREIMSTICRLFDPLGIISPVISRAKILMKDVWRSNCGWDEAVDTELEAKWRKYIFELQTLNEIRANRWISFSPNYISVQLHGFCDASFHAYGAGIYLRIVDENEQISTSLVMSKSKVAPMSPVTIPRLELCGAVVLAELMEYTINTLRHIKVKPEDIKLWTDSQTALQWIRTDPNRWQMFVSNRVAAIQKASNINQWNHVRTFDNPADLISRGASPNDLCSSDLWW